MDLDGTRHTHDMFPCGLRCSQVSGTNLLDAIWAEEVQRRCPELSWQVVWTTWNFKGQRQTSNIVQSFKSSERLWTSSEENKGRMQIIDCEYDRIVFLNVFFNACLFRNVWVSWSREHLLDHWSWLGPDCGLILKAPSVLGGIALTTTIGGSRRSNNWSAG